MAVYHNMICKKTHSEYTHKCCHNDLCAYHERGNKKISLDSDNLEYWLNSGGICKNMIPFVKQKIEELKRDGN